MVKFHKSFVVEAFPKHGVFKREHYKMFNEKRTQLIFKKFSPKQRKAFEMLVRVSKMSSSITKNDLVISQLCKFLGEVGERGDELLFRLKNLRKGMTANQLSQDEKRVLRNFQKDVIKHLTQLHGRYKRRKVNTETRHYIVPMLVEVEELQKKANGTAKVYISCSKASRLDIVNTLSTLQSNIPEFDGTFVQEGENFVISMSQKTLHRVQIGWNCLLMSNSRTLRYTRIIPSFPWIIRCFLDEDNQICIMGVEALLKLVTTSKSHDLMTQFSSNELGIIRRLPELLLKFGKRRLSDGSAYYSWEQKYADDYYHSPFVEGLVSFLSPPTTTFNLMHIKPEGVALLKSYLDMKRNRCIEFTDCENKLQIFVNYVKTSSTATKHKFTSPKHFSFYVAFYEFMLQDHVSDVDALNLFMSVQSVKQAKSFKNKIQALNKNDTIYSEGLSVVNDVYETLWLQCQTHKIERTRKNEGIRALMLLLEYIEFGRSYNQDKFNHITGIRKMQQMQRISDIGPSHYLRQIILAKPNFTPVAQVCKGKKDRKDILSTSCFPLHKLNKKYFDKAKEILHDVKSIFE